MSATCKHCSSEYYGPSVPHIDYSQYCQVCKECSTCHRQIDPEALTFSLKYQVEWPLTCTNCQAVNYRDQIENRRIPITAKELDWLNRVRLMIDVNMDCSVDTNMRSAELAAGSWIAEMDQDGAYMFLKRMEAITATVAVLLKKSTKEIKLKLEAKQRLQYQAAQLTSHNNQLEQCGLCKKRFKLTEIDGHKLKCTGDLTTLEKANLKRRERAFNAFKSIGLSDEQIEEQLRNTFDKVRTK